MMILLLGKSSEELNNMKRYVRECRPDDEILEFTDEEKAIKCIANSDKNIDMCFASISRECGVGLRVTRSIKERGRKIKVILIADSKEWALDAWNMGASDYLMEPLSLDNVQHAFDKCCQ